MWHYAEPLDYHAAQTMLDLGIPFEQLGDGDTEHCTPPYSEHSSTLWLASAFSTLIDIFARRWACESEETPMLIAVVCTCGSKITVGGHFAGKVGKCKRCGQRLTIPWPEPMADVVDANSWVHSATLDDEEPIMLPEPVSSRTADTIECPYCGEEIRAIARKCKHCGEFLDASLRGQSVVVGAGSTAPQVIVQNTNVIEARRHPGYGIPEREWSPGIAAVLSLVIPGAGQMYKGNVGGGICWLIGTIFAYCFFIFPGLVVHLLCIISAGSGKQ
jgi:hypothetical protein